MNPKLCKSIDQTRVLVVEDTARLSDALVDGVRQAGFESHAADSAEDAQSLMERSPFDILLLDLHLPGMSGMEFFSIVRSRWPDTEVIILTGYGDLEAARQAVHLDAVEFLTKPASLGEIELALNKAWQRRASRAPAVDPADIEDQTIDEGQTSRSLEQIERDTILEVLDRHHGNREAAAAELGISVRKLYYRLAEYRR